MFDRDGIRKAFSAGMAVLMLGMSVVVPVLERADLQHQPIVEQQHDPGDCPSGHDHTICTQVGANLLIATAHDDASLAFNVVPVDAETLLRSFTASWLGDGRRSRAPPQA